ncbi:MAG: hypothetical protein V4850_14595 [Myxococcota bacterium]
MSAPGSTVVDCAGAGDFSTLAEALAVASDGDIIDVAPCTYTEQVDFGGRSVTLRATSPSLAQGGPADTIIDAEGAGPVVVARSGEGDGTAVIGFTLTGGVETAFGGAVFVDLSSIRLEDVTVTGNRGTAILYSHSGAVELRDVTFTANSVTEGGAAITLYRGTLDATGVDLGCDGGAYGMYFGHGTALIDASNIACAAGTPVYWDHATGRLERSRLDGPVVVINEAEHEFDVVTMENDIFTSGQGIYVEYGTAILRNSVVNGPLTLVGVGAPVVEANVFLGGRCAIDADPTTEPFSPAYNSFWGATSESCDGTVWSGADGNFTSDPLFTDQAGGDYTLLPGSPCVDAGLPAPAHTDPDGTRNDIGAYGGHKSIGGGW